MPKRDVRALCANQSAGSTKKRQKKKPKVEPVDGIISLDSQPHQPPDTTQTAKPLTPYLPVPLPQQSNPTSTLMDWTARNPGLAQYHQYVLQSQQHGKGAKSSDDPSAAIMQRLQAT
jgi:hypothetical protein